MNILLINPPTNNIISTTQAKYIISERGFTPPLGLLYLASAIKEITKHDVKIVDCQLHNFNEQKIKEEIERYDPDIVGITTITFMLIDCISVANLVKRYEQKKKKRVYVVAGGPHVTIFPEETAQLESIDFALAGEAEFRFIDLIENLEKGVSPNSIPGVFFRHNGNMISGPKHSYIQDIDSIPIPDRTLLDYEKYSNVLSGGGIMTTMMTSRGCPYKCIFCDRLGKTFRAVSAEKVVMEIENCLELGIRNIFFHDDTFTIDKDRVLHICRIINKKGLKFKFSLRSRVNTIDEEMIRALKESGCERISFGVESGVQRILNRIKKGITLTQAEKAFSLTRVPAAW